MGKLFGTDGIRGVVNRDLDAMIAFRVGMAAAIVMGELKHGRTTFTIGKDTRISSDMLEAALMAGLCSAGADVLHLGVVPTPAVAYLTKRNGADAGVVISASHNPYEHNGIKIFNGEGFKLFDALEERIEELVLSNRPLPVKTDGEIGRVIFADRQQSGLYVEHLLSTVPEGSIRNLKIAVDCANGAAAATAPKLFQNLPVQADFYFVDPDGININNGCGSTHLETISRIVREGGYDIGLAFDGDADRCLAVDENGMAMDGDQIMALCALYLREKGGLQKDTMVATVMSNLGFHVFSRENGLNLICTDVGDRNVLECMLREGYSLGGEQSGHMIFLEHATTGDGQLTALQFLRVLCQAGCEASTLAARVPRYPQVLVNVPVADRSLKQRVMEADALNAAIGKAQQELGESGRILVRPSGTESLIRVMVEAARQEIAEQYANNLANVIKKVQIKFGQ